jgi:hypothetical protein
MVEAERLSGDYPIGVSKGGIQWNLIMLFPWGANLLDEGWVEISAREERFWLEIPYGFLRDSKEPVLPSSLIGPPEFVPAMKLLKPTDHILRWVNVEYDLGEIREIGENAQFTLFQSNPYQATSEIELYREENEWNLDSPRTAVEIREPDGDIITGLCNQIRLHEGCMRRSDFFRVWGTNGDTRRWGIIEINFGKKTYRTMIPSSLYEHLHGRADERKESETK